ncbi:MAG: hypothetical protein ACRDXB_17020, partial [Actinomycetes bacterium]
PHLLVIPAVGATAARLAVEASAARRGWPTATGPADADIIVVAGSPSPELAAVIGRVWQQVPKPRVRVVVSDALDVDRNLDAAVTRLADREYQQAPSHSSHTSYEEHDGHEGAGGDDGHGGSHMDHGRHGHHGHHDHGGGMVAGLPMADLGEDRDGLNLDRLHVPLGPVLPDWPAGLVVQVTLQGDVIQEASAQVLGNGPAVSFEWSSAAARELDGLARLLGVAGWPSAAGCARGLRDEVLAAGSSEEIARAAAALVRRVRRSRTLRWLVRGIPAGAADVATVLGQRLTAVESAVGSGSPVSSARAAVEELPGLLVGAELAAARLIVAALDPDTEQVRVRKEVRRG